MKLFDIIGIVVVAVWLGLSGLFIYRAQSSSASQSSQRSAEFVMREGATWLVLRRNTQDAGYVHQTRTELADGWLLEHDTYMVVDLLGEPQSIDASVKTRLDIDGYLRQFTTEVRTSGGVFKATGKVEGETLRLSTTLGDDATTESIALDKPVRLSINALNALVAADGLTPGQTYGASYMDPYFAKLSPVEMRYIENRELEVYDENFQADHFRKRAGERELDFYVDAEADLLIRAFPLRTTAARIPAALGKTRSASIRRQLETRNADAAKDASEAGERKTLRVAVARQILAGQFSRDELGLADANEPSAERPTPADGDERPGEMKIAE